MIFKTKIYFRCSCYFLVTLLGVIFIFVFQTEAKEGFKYKSIKEGRIIKQEFHTLGLDKKNPFKLKITKQISLKLDKKINGYYYKLKEYTSPPLKTDFDFNGVGLKLKGLFPKETLVDSEIRIKDKENKWTSWYKLEEVKDFPQKNFLNPNTKITNPVFLGSSHTLQYKIKISTLNPKVTPVIRKVEVIYFDTENQIKFIDKIKEKISSSLFSPLLAKPTLKIISRKKWGADESWRFDSHGNEIWPREYVKVKKFIIHHTAGSNGRSNPKAVIRGIYYWHAHILGWGDIGYNFLIDPYGNIYEGRYGGDNVVGGHTYDSQNHINYNRGSIGIAILGDYEPRSSNPNPDILTNRARKALANLIAFKGAKHKIKPKGKSKFYGRLLPNIFTHRDVDSTLCPGRNIYRYLPEIRNLAQKKYNSLIFKSVKVLQAKLIDINFPSQLDIGEKIKVTLKIKNLTNNSWSSKKLKLLIYDKNSNKSSFYIKKWPQKNGQLKPKQKIIKPGKIATFQFYLKAPLKEKNYIEILEIQYGNKSIYKKRWTRIIKVKANYKAHFKSISLTPAVLNIWRYPVTIKFKNVGKKEWRRKEVELLISSSRSKISPFYDKSWPEKKGKIKMKEKIVKPGGIATFTFYEKAPKKTGLYRQRFELRFINNKIKIKNGIKYQLTRVDSALEVLGGYKAQFVSINLTPAVLNIWRPTVIIRFKNIGRATWYKDQVVLKTYKTSRGGINPFKDYTWASNYGDFRFLENEVRPGGIATFVFKIKPPSSFKVHRQVFQIYHLKYDDIIPGSIHHQLTRVDPVY